MAEEQRKLENSKARGSLLRYLPLAAILMGVIAFFATGLNRSLSFEAFVDYEVHLQQLVAEHRLKMLGLYVLIYVTAVTLSLPASAFLTTIGGFLFGWALGGTVAAMAATVGATSIFLIARSSLGQPLLRRAGSRVQAFAAGFQKQAFSYLLFLRLMPVMPFWLTNLAAAFFGVRLKTFILATQIGMIPTSFAFAFAGSGLDDVIVAQQKIRSQCIAIGGTDCGLHLSAKSLLTRELMIALVILGILALAPILVRRWQQRHAKGTEPAKGVEREEST